MISDAITLPMVEGLIASRKPFSAGDSSRHDKLTGFLNRGGLDKALQDLWKGPFSQVAAIMIDIDYFKSYNDHHGHLAGDACVKQIAATKTMSPREPIAAADAALYASRRTAAAGSGRAPIDQCSASSARARTKSNADRREASRLYSPRPIR
jgi:Diguanylate cyclase, GGDEF domain